MYKYEEQAQLLAKGKIDRSSVFLASFRIL